MKNKPPLRITYEKDLDLRELVYTEVTDEKVLAFFFKKGGEVNVMNLMTLVTEYGKRDISKNIVSLEAAGLIKSVSSNSYKVTRRAKWRRIYSHPTWNFWAVVIGVLALIVAVITIIIA